MVKNRKALGIQVAANLSSCCASSIKLTGLCLFCVFPLSFFRVHNNVSETLHSLHQSSCPNPLSMASLHKLLSEEGFQTLKPDKKVKFKVRRNSAREDSIALPIYICHDRRSLDSSRPRAAPARSLKGSSRKGGSGSERSTTTPRRDEPAIDDVAIKAMIAILSGYVGQYSRDRNFRTSVREKCRSCFERRKKKGLDDDVFARMEMGIQSIEKLVESSDIMREMDLDSLQKSIKTLNIVASLDSDEKPTSYLSACANLYLSIIYKMAKNDKISARHLLQVFSDSPFLARKHLLSELWEHFFLPHLLHLKIWYNKELEFLANSGYADKEKKMKALNKQYNELMDIGTTQFANYYKEWLKVGAQPPPIPTVPLPAKPTHARSRRKSSESSAISKSLYQEVFGKGGSMHLDNENGAPRNVWDDLEVEEDFKHMNHVEEKGVGRIRRSSSQSNRIQRGEPWHHDTQKSDYFRFLGCRKDLVQGSYIIANNDKIKNDERGGETIHVFQTNDPSRAISTICSSQSLTECEMAIRLVSEAWLNCNGDSEIEASLSQASVVQGILEVLYVSNDDEILELAISILAEIATKSEANRQCVLNSDPNLDVLIRLLRNGSLFLKAAVLLYIVKPKASQMVSMEWIPLVLRVLEFGDQWQTLFTVRCSPHEAAYYFLNQLLTVFDLDKNLDNARQVVSFGGLSLLVRRMDLGDTLEKSKAACVLRYCIRADGSCRHYLAKNVKQDAILSLLVKEANPHGHALELLAELLCLSRRNQRVEYLTGFTKGWNGLNTLQILLLRLHKACLEERPIIAVTLLQLDLLGDPFEYSVYREEAIDAIITALDCCVFNEKIQEQSARALMILGGHFSYSGEPDIEKNLLRKAEHENMNEEDENWQRRAAIVMLTSGKTRLLSALADSIANSIPCLARASLVTVCWMSSYLHCHGDKVLQRAACSILVPQLIECLKDNSNNLEEKIIASFSLQSLTKCTDYCLRLEKEVLSSLEKLSTVTWTAKELVSVITSNSSEQFV